jgi:hypothetical protein
MYEKIKHNGLEIVLRYNDGHDNPLEWVDVNIYPTKKKRSYEVLVQARPGLQNKGHCIDFQELVRSYRLRGMTGREAHFRALDEVAKIKAMYDGSYTTSLIFAEYEDIQGNVFTSEDCRSVDFYCYWGYSPDGKEIRHRKDDLDIEKDDLVPLIEDVISQSINHALEKHDYYALRYMQERMGTHFWAYALFGFKEKYAEILNAPKEKMGVI